MAVAWPDSLARDGPGTASTFTDVPHTVESSASEFMPRYSAIRIKRYPCSGDHPPTDGVLRARDLQIHSQHGANS